MHLCRRHAAGCVRSARKPPCLSGCIKLTVGRCHCHRWTLSNGLWEGVSHRARAADHLAPRTAGTPHVVPVISMVPPSASSQFANNDTLKTFLGADGVKLSTFQSITRSAFSRMVESLMLVASEYLHRKFDRFSTFLMTTRR